MNMNKNNNDHFDKIGNSIELHNINFDNSYNPLRFFISIFKIVTLIVKYKPIIVYSFTIKPNIIAVLISYFFVKISFVITFTGLGNLYLRSKKLYILLFKILLFKNNKNNFFLFHNNYDLNIFKNLFKISKYSVINGSGITLENNLKNIIKDNKLRVISVCRPLKEKGFNDYLQLVSNLSHIKDVEFSLFTDIETNNQNNYNANFLKELVSNKYLKLLTSKDNLIQSLKSNDIFILLSKREGLSHAMISSLNIGLPIICLKVPGNIDLILNNHNGYLIKDDNNKLEEINKILIDLLINKHKLKLLSSNAKSTIDISFSHDYIFKIYERLLLNN